MTKRRDWWLWFPAGLTLLLQLFLCRFFSPDEIPLTSDYNPGNYQSVAFQFPPYGFFSFDFWLGFPHLPEGLHPLSILAHLPPHAYFTAFYPIFGALAYAGFYQFLRSAGLDRAPACLGGLAYAWQGQILSNIYPGHFAPAPLYALFAMAAWAVLEGYRSQKLVIWALGGIACGWMVCMLPDRGSLAALLVGLLILQIILAGKKERAQAIRGAVILVVMAFLAASPGLHSILKTNVQGVEQGEGGGEKEKWDWATQWSMTPEEYISYLVPGVWGWFTGDPDHPYWGKIGRDPNWTKDSGMRNFYLDFFGFGTIPFLLFFLGSIFAWCRGDSLGEETKRLARFFMVTALIFILLALGKYAPFYQWFYRLPYMSTWRNPLKFMVCGNFALIFLAAVGAQALYANWKNEEKNAKGKRFIELGGWGIFGTMVVLFLFTYLAAFVLGPALSASGYNAVEVSKIFKTMRGAFLMGLLLMFLVNAILVVSSAPSRFQDETFVNPWLQGLWRLALRKENVAGAGLVMLAFLSVLQMAWVHSHYISSYHWKKTYSESALNEVLKSSEEPIRVKLADNDPFLHWALSTIFPYHHIECLDIPAVSRMPDDYAAFFAAAGKDQFRLLNLGGVKMLLAPASYYEGIHRDPSLASHIVSVRGFAVMGSLYEPDIIPVEDFRQASHIIVEIKDTLPRAFLALGIEVRPNISEVWNRVGDSSWDPRRSVLLVSGDAARIGAATKPEGNPSTVMPVHWKSWDEHRLELEALAPEPAMLVINNRFDPDWKATINGKPSEVVRVNGIMCGILLPKGPSKIVISYRPDPTFVYVELLALAAVAVWGIRCWQSGRKNPLSSNDSVISE